MKTLLPMRPSQSEKILILGRQPMSMIAQANLVPLIHIVVVDMALVGLALYTGKYITANAILDVVSLSI